MLWTFSTMKSILFIVVKVQEKFMSSPTDDDNNISNEVIDSGSISVR
ncbi:hypothetical protein DDB_G0294162 [Dictyostelium discoideum AX4]|uniref:Uncharacterized protein n=1 Tax=Dictyostelium discoideum TaxID=44689 RepID=Q54AW4_DICDI|nr:hypothetical protein DDB_G0294162 [Dictyostelium discoideum AX4]EAL60409.1 hypothetical protein DDB_G0294162 [Dictyostelium discoideum AX4]|eukprot:XP_628822.1 hypothetical protein DDB_G0294162 [Dictyostelium discoideum AX4]